MTARRQTFQRASRLTRPVEFRRVFSRPVVTQDRYFRVLSRCNEQTAPRLGLAVSTKVSKRAVVRNRLKRLVRESFRRHLQLLGGATGSDTGSDTALDTEVDPEFVSGLDIVVLPSREAASMCNETLNRALADLWRKTAEKHRSRGRSSKGKN